MKKALKKIVLVVVTILACLSFVMMTAEAETATLQLLVTGGSMAIFYGCYKILDKMGVLNDNN